MQDFRKLDVWRKSHEMVLEVYRTVPGASERRFPGLAGQLKRAAASVPANIVEGCGHASDKELGRLLQLAVASANEVQYHLILARDLGMLPSAAYARLEARADEVKKMLVGLLRRIRERVNRKSPPTAPC